MSDRFPLVQIGTGAIVGTVLAVAGTIILFLS
jgi:hypothetical protein